MIHSEKKILRSLTKLTRNTNDIIYCDQCGHKFILVHDSNVDGKSVPFDMENIIPLLKMLADKGYIIFHNHPRDIYFSLTVNTVYRLQISFDHLRYAFFCKFIYGLISGIIIGVASTLIAEHIMIELGWKAIVVGDIMGLPNLYIW